MALPKMRGSHRMAWAPFWETAAPVPHCWRRGYVMAVDRTYRCDLCRDTYRLDEGRLIGLHWSDGWIEKQARAVERHICCACLSSLQALGPRCGQGFECTGGPKCGSDHK